VFSCKQCERRERHVLKFLIQALGEVALFQLVKGDFPQENIAYIYSVEQLKNNGFSFTKIGNVCLLYQFLTSYLKMKNDCPNPSFQYYKKHFHMLKHI
jgi:hypothetical protein